MLSELTIENVAVIEKAQVEFGEGLNVLTGETGAGKSILIDSINAILGNRTSRDLVRNGAEKAVIWATFTDITAAAKDLLTQAGYEVEDDLLVSREITLQGKTTCRIGGKPATASILKEVCSLLINIHGQHDNQTLLCPEKHLAVLDAFAQNSDLREEYHASYVVLRDIVRQLKALTMDEGEKQRRLDILQYEVDEIENAALRDGEEEELGELRDRIRNAEHIMQALTQTYASLENEDGESNAVELLSTGNEALSAISSLSEEYRAAAEKAAELYYGAQELASDIKELIEGFDFNPAELDRIEERLDLIHKLKRKYGQSIAEVLKYGQSAAEELESIHFSEEKIEKLMQQRKNAGADAKHKATALTENRKQAFERFANQIAQSLQFLNMPGIVLKLQYEEGKLGPNGQDIVEFLISTNPGEPPKPLAKIASGGELSRIMLAIKSVMADKDAISSLIYDEIDTGVSGLAAGRIGEKLKQTAHSHQVICVTHTAQIAAQADRHLLIRKTVQGERTFTEIEPLDADGRIKELARIISGDRITDLALANAREMLQLAGA